MNILETFDKDNLREELRGLLHDHEVRISFEKKDGTIRQMTATLMPSLLPVREVAPAEDKPAKAVNLSVLPVFDLEVNEWRSFRIDSLKSVELV